MTHLSSPKDRPPGSIGFVEPLPVRQAVTFLQASSLAAVRSFYADALGLSLVLDQGQCLIYRVRKGCFWGFCESAGPVSGGAVLTLVTAEVEAWHERATRLGLETDGPARVNAEFRIRHFYIAAPDGNRVEVQEFLDPAWDPNG